MIYYKQRLHKFSLIIIWISSATPPRTQSHYRALKLYLAIQSPSYMSDRFSCTTCLHFYKIPNWSHVLKPCTSSLMFITVLLLMELISLSPPSGPVILAAHLPHTRRKKSEREQLILISSHCNSRLHLIDSTVKMLMWTESSGIFQRWTCFQNGIFSVFTLKDCETKLERWFKPCGRCRIERLIKRSC